jgi:glucose-specific phosphotransferase system IIA component
MAALMSIVVTAPVPGTAAPLTEVPDPVFAGAMVGPGVAIWPDLGTADVVSPIAGTLVKLKPHAFVVQEPGGRAVLVHLGIDTVGLNGDGFTVVATEGQQVQAGEVVVRWSPGDVARRGLSPVCPVVALDAPADAIVEPAAGAISAGDMLFTWN